MLLADRQEAVGEILMAIQVHKRAGRTGSCFSICPYDADDPLAILNSLFRKHILLNPGSNPTVSILLG